MNVSVASEHFSDAGRTTRRIRLGDLLDYEQPTKYLVESTDYSDEHPTPVLTAGKSFILGYTSETDGIYAGPFPVIIFDDFTTSLHLVDFPFKVKSSAMKILRAHDPNISLSLVVELIRGIGFQPSDHKRHWISEFQNFEIDLPIGDYHDFVARAISSADAKIDTLKAKKSALEDYKRGLMQKLFSREIRFTREDGTTFPDWNIRALGEVAQCYQPRTKSVSETTLNGMFPVYGANGVIGRSNDVNHADSEVFVSCRGSCGDVNRTEGPAWINGNAMVVRPKSTREIAKNFLYYSLLSGDLRYLISGTSQPQITSDIKEHQIEVPCHQEQKMIASALDAIEVKISKTKDQLNRMGVFKKGLLQKLFV